MNKPLVALLLLLSTALLAGCESTATPQSNTPAANTTLSAHVASHPVATKPTLDLHAQVSGTTATLKFHTTNFQLAPEHYSQAHVPGEGHIHLFVDGSLTRIPVKENTYVLSDLAPGSHELRAALHTNNHQPYDVEDKITIMVQP